MFLRSIRFVKADNVEHQSPMRIDERSYFQTRHQNTLQNRQHGVIIIICIVGGRFYLMPSSGIKLATMLVIDHSC
jgi:hypothetical protein